MPPTRKTHVLIISAPDRVWQRPLAADAFKNPDFETQISSAIEGLLEEAWPAADQSTLLIEVDIAEQTAACLKEFVSELTSALRDIIGGQSKTESRKARRFYLSIEKLPLRPSGTEETVAVSAEETRAANRLTARFHDGKIRQELERNYSTATEAYLRAAQERESELPTTPAKLLRRITDDLKSLHAAKVIFRADETGYRESFEVLDAMHRVALACRCVLTLDDRPIFARRLLPPMKSGNKRVQLCVHDYATGTALGSPATTLPELNLKPVADVVSSDPEGPFQVVRQRKIEHFRRRLLGLAGDRALDRDDAKELRNAINQHRHKLGVGLAVFDGESLHKVSLEVSHTSFQVKRGRLGYLPDFSGPEFPHLLLVDDQFAA